MSERSTLNQTIQIGVETTPGTSVAASKKLRSIGIEPNITGEGDTFRPAGDKYLAFASLGKEWVEASISGRGSYTELQYLLSSVCNYAAPVTATGATTWTFSSSNTAADVPKTYTVEHGSDVRADKFTHGLVTEFGMTFNRSSIEVSGSMIGKALTDGITMTAAPTSVALVPTLPTQVSVYVDSTSANLGNTKLTRAISAEWSLGSRFAPVWVLDAAQSSFVSFIESEPDLTATLTLQANSDGMAFLNQYRDKSTLFLRIEAVGSIFTGSTPYKLTIDQACKITETGGFSDSDGVYAVQFTFAGVNDPTWGKAFEVKLVNDVAAL